MLAAGHVLLRSANEPLLRHFPVRTTMEVDRGASTADCHGFLPLRDVCDMAISEARKDFQ